LLDRLTSLVESLATTPYFNNTNSVNNDCALVQSSAMSTSTTTPSGWATSLPDTIHNRRDAFHTLTLARQYFERNEPSHPAPMLIQRIEKLENLNFAQIISELTPDALAQLKQLAGESLSP